MSATADPPQLPYPLSITRLHNGAIWREYTLHLRRYLGDCVPVISCVHHRGETGVTLYLTWSGDVFSSSGPLFVQPWFVAGLLEQFESDVASGSGDFTSRWALTGLEAYVAYWINAPLPPAIRSQMAGVGKLIKATEKLPAQQQTDSLALRGLLCLAGGHVADASRAADSLLGRDPQHDGARFVRGLIEYTRGGRDLPPVGEYVRAQLRWQRCPSIAVAVVKQGRILTAEGYGVSNTERRIESSKDTVYAICSMTKSFTATGIMALVEGVGFAWTIRSLVTFPTFQLNGAR